MYENKTMKPIEIVLRSRERAMRKNDGGGNLIKIYFKNICKCHNVFTLCTYYMPINFYKTQRKKKHRG
jgi:hypothetical protein